MNSENQNKQNSNDSRVAPTDLRNTDIEMFGQENIPYMNMHRKNNISDIEVTSNSEFNNIGTVPPGSFTEAMPKKFNINKILFLVVVFLVIGLIGGGIYFYLSSSRKVAEKAVITKTITISVGDKLSLKLDDYATFYGVKATNCILDIENVKNDVPGKYTYVISCGVNNYKGSIIVEDKLPPIVETKILLKNVNEDIEVSEFIISCEDNSECKYELENFEELKENLKTEGVYDAKIKVLDEDGNTRNIIEKVIVSDLKAEGILRCSYKNLKLDNYDGYYDVIETTIYNDNYGEKIIMDVIFTFGNKDEYDSLKKAIDEAGNLTIEGISGRPYFLNNNSLMLEMISSVNEISYLNGNELSDIEDFYTSSGYTCNRY